MPSTRVLTSSSLRRLRKIHRLSVHYNHQVGKRHPERLLELMAHHVEEIRDLWREGDRHALVEAGDLAVLCFELLLEYRASPDRIMRECFGRYEKKLSALLAETERERNRRGKRPNKR